MNCRIRIGDTMMIIEDNVDSGSTHQIEMMDFSSSLAKGVRVHTELEAVEVLQGFLESKPDYGSKFAEYFPDFLP